MPELSSKRQLGEAQPLSSPPLVLILPATSPLSNAEADYGFIATCWIPWRGAIDLLLYLGNTHLLLFGFNLAFIWLSKEV